MTAARDRLPSCTFDEAERQQLRDWIGLPAAKKIDFFEEMIELAYQSGALSPERLALRDQASTAATPPSTG